jgi:DNA-directed RNA polymerase subunit N (RpoN/RPB10)
MIIPVRCFTCGKVIGNKYKAYLDKLATDMSEMYGSCVICVYDVCALQNRDDRVSFDRYDAAFTRWHYSSICCLHMMHSFQGCL